MYTIRILKDFAQQSRNEMYAALMRENEMDFCIEYQKVYFTSVTERVIFGDYLLATYTGQKLFEISQYFTYNIPSVNTNDPFLFHITVTDIAQLADALFYIGYENNTASEDFDIDVYDKYTEDALAWYDNIEEATEEVACFGLYNITLEDEK